MDPVWQKTGIVAGVTLSGAHPKVETSFMLSLDLRNRADVRAAMLRQGAHLVLAVDPEKYPGGLKPESLKEAALVVSKILFGGDWLETLKALPWVEGVTFARTLVCDCPGCQAVGPPCPVVLPHPQKDEASTSAAQAIQWLRGILTTLRDANAVGGPAKGGSAEDFEDVPDYGWFAGPPPAGEA